jgi:hypothetical protein
MRTHHRQEENGSGGCEAVRRLLNARKRSGQVSILANWRFFRLNLGFGSAICTSEKGGTGVFSAVSGAEKEAGKGYGRYPDRRHHHG